MQIILKQKIQAFEVLEITKELIGTVLCDTENLKQEIIEQDNKLILHEIEKAQDNEYRAVKEVWVNIELGDILLKQGLTYIKLKKETPYIVVDNEIKEAIDKLGV